MRTSWNGSVSMSLLSIPVKLGSAVGDNDPKSHQYAPDGSRVQYKRVSSGTGKEVAYADIRKGYDAPDGSVVFLTDKDLELAYGEVSRQAQILMFASGASVPDIAKCQPMLVQPGKGGDKAYALLERTLRKTGKVAILLIGIRQRKRLASLSADPGREGYLLLQRIEWTDDVRQPDFPVPDVQITDAEQELAETLITSMSGDFDYSAHHDDSQRVLNELIAQRMESGEKMPAPEPAAQDGSVAVANLMALLQASIDAKKAES